MGAVSQIITSSSDIGNSQVLIVARKTLSVSVTNLFVLMVTVYVGTIDSKADYFEKIVALQLFQVVYYALRGRGRLTFNV